MKTCLHTVSYAGTWGQAALTLEQTIDKAAELGFDGIMLMAKRPHGSVLDMTPDRRGAIKAQLDERGIECACIAGYTNFTADVAHGDVPIREMQIAHVTELGQLAADLGCDVVRIFTGYETPELGYIPALEQCVRSVQECCDRVADLGVTLGVQNHHDVAAGWEAMGEFIEAVDRPNCRACFDAWSPYLHGSDLVAAATAMAPVTVHTTAADYVKIPRYKYLPDLINYTDQPAYVRAVPMGEGDIDYAGFLGALKSGGCDGWVGYEMCSHLRGGGSMENLDTYARKFLEFVDAVD